MIQPCAVRDRAEARRRVSMWSWEMGSALAKALHKQSLNPIRDANPLSKWGLFRPYNAAQGIPRQPAFQRRPFVCVLANFCSLFKPQLLSPWLHWFLSCHQLTMGWYEHLCYCFCTVYQSNVSADWGLAGRIKPVLHRAWWIVGFTYHFGGYFWWFFLNGVVSRRM